MVKYFKIILILLLRHHFLLAQNLMPNSSFEEYKKCPKKEAEFKKNVLKWNTANKASPDYYNTCSSNKLTNTKANFGGSQFPHSGNAYAAILLYYSDFENFREYIQCQLIQPLKPHQIYCCSFYISLADKSTVFTNRIGMFFSENKNKTRNKLVIDKDPQIENKQGLYLDNKDSWILICDTFRAIGNEEYITIGNFYDNKHTSLKTVDDIKAIKKKYPKSYNNDAVDDAYYYIDDVSVTALTNESDCPCKDKKTDSVLVNHKPKATTDTIAPTIGESIILRNLVFETNKTEILPSSYEELNKVADYLIKHNKNKIELSGHTDNTGKEEDNQKLSEARAKAVADYLINKGILKERISYKGYGSTKPIATNNTEEGKQENRRVEFMIE